MTCSPTRCLTVWLAVTAAAVTVGRWAAAGLEPGSWPGSLASFDTLVPALASLVLIACATWAWGVTTYVIVEVRRERDPGRTAIPRAAPPWARRVILAACGVALLGSTSIGPSHATPGHISVVGEHAGRDDGTGVEAVTGLPLPDRTSGPLLAAGRIGEAAVALARGVPLTVQVGDSLWSIAERLLGPGATTTETADLVGRLYETNHRAIGDDPDLILPGHHLLMPLEDRPAR